MILLILFNLKVGVKDVFATSAKIFIVLVNIIFRYRKLFLCYFYNLKRNLLEVVNYLIRLETFIFNSNYCLQEGYQNQSLQQLG